MDTDAVSRTQPQTDLNSSPVPELDLSKMTAPVHFIGLGGIGMSAIARLLLAQGRAVSGSDQSDSEIMQELAALGAKTFVGHAATNVKEAGAVVVSTAIVASNPEIIQARELNLPIVHRSDLLRQLSKSYKMIAISGTHGKTTTTGLVSQVSDRLQFRSFSCSWRYFYQSARTDATAMASISSLKLMKATVHTLILPHSFQ